MPLFVVADLVLGALAMVGFVGLGYYAGRHPAADPEDEVVRSDLMSALRSWGAAVFLLGLLALAQMPGGFTLPIWTLLALGFGAVGAVIVVLRWRVEGWDLRGVKRRADGPEVESETWQYGLIGAVAGLATGYVLGLVFNIMQPVHLGIAMLEGAVGYAVGLAIWTPQVKVHRRAASAPSSPLNQEAIQRHASRRRPRRTGRRGGGEGGSPD